MPASRKAEVIETSNAQNTQIGIPDERICIPEILSNCFYKAKNIEALFGRRFLENLREAGLRAVGDWYLGESILDAFKHAMAKKAGQRVPEERNSVREKEHVEGMDESRNAASIQPIPKHREPATLSAQVKSLRQLSSPKIQRSERRKSA